MSSLLSIAAIFLILFASSGRAHGGLVMANLPLAGSAVSQRCCSPVASPASRGWWFVTLLASPRAT
jgi:hypothetical protein